LPADMIALSNCLATMKSNYLENPVTSVRGSNFIFPLHAYCISELNRIISPSTVQTIPLTDMSRPTGKPHYPKTPIDASKYQLMQEATLFGSHKNKDTDIIISHYANGPQIIIGVRSQMSSIGKNIENYYEGIIGECISLHDRFPMATIGYVYMLPTRPIKPGLNEEVNLEKAESLFEKITGRTDWRSSHDKYEHFAFLKVDFTKDPPEVLSTKAHLQIETFFDRLIETHNDRNIFNPITTI